MCFLYTDGLVEAMDASDEEFGMERLMFTLRGMLVRGTSQAFLDGVFEALQSFVGRRGFEDDITMVAMRRLPG